MGSNKDTPEKPAPSVIKPAKIGPRSKVGRTSAFSAEDEINFVPYMTDSNGGKGKGKDKEPLEDDSDVICIGDSDGNGGTWRTDKMKKALPEEPSLPPKKSIPAAGKRGISSKAPAAKNRVVPSLPTNARLKRYNIGDDEMEEYAELEVMNETPPEEGNDSVDGIPCRILNDFVIFDKNCNNSVVDIRDLFDDYVDLSISGDVSAMDMAELHGTYVVDDDDEDDDDDNDDASSVGHNGNGDSAMRTTKGGGASKQNCHSNHESDFESDCSGKGNMVGCGNKRAAGTGRTGGFRQRIYLSAILNYESFRSANGATEIWVLTSFAWYKLLTPHPGYAHVYSPLYKTIYMAHQALILAEAEPRLTITQFVKRMRTSPDDTIASLSPITESDFRSNRDSIILEIEASVDAGDAAQLLVTPLIAAICREKLETKRKEPSRNATAAVSRARRSNTKPKTENPACITTLVASIAKGLYAQHLVKVSHFESKSTKTAQEAPGSSANSDDDGALATATTVATKGKETWRKKYSSKGSTKKMQADQDLGKVSVSDLFNGGVSLQHFRVQDVKPIESKRLPKTDKSRVYYSEVDLFLKPNTQCVTPDLEGPVSLKVGDTVMISVVRPLTEHALETIWDTETADNTDAAVSGPFARVFQVTSIYYISSNSCWTVHGQIMMPGRDTILQEVALPNEWFLIDECHTYPLINSVCGKIGIPFVATEDEIDTFKAVEDKMLFCRFWYDPASAMFEDVNKHSMVSGDRYPMWCLTCDSKSKNKNVKINRVVAGTVAKTLPGSTPNSPRTVHCPKYVDTVSVAGTEYHQHDFVYLPTQQTDQPFEIAYIVDFKENNIRNNPQFATTDLACRVVANVRILKRLLTVPPDCRPDVGDADYNDGRHLYWTEIHRHVNVEFFRGKCWVSHIEDIEGNLNVYKDSDVNAFYCRFEVSKAKPQSPSDWFEIKPFRDNSSSEMLLDDDDGDDRFPMERPCEICKRTRERHLELLTRFLQHPEGHHSSVFSKHDGASENVKSSGTSFMRGKQPLRALDLFSGCGGLTQGMDQSGVVKTMWAVEFMESAGITFAKNHPETQVYNQCSNLLLDSAIKAHQGVSAKPLKNKFDGKELPPMPQPGDVDFIYCGPPCQGFSRCNRFIKADDIKTSLIANALSYVDFYRPTYFLLENVRGLLNYKLGGIQLGKGRIGGGIEMGMLKFILRTLTTMGYQARFYVLQAGNYGLAQSRRRLFVWACKRGCRLPGVPLPMTTFEKSNQTNIIFPNGTVYAPLAHLNGHAPHHAITVEDAINDLPKFDFINPAISYPDPDPDAHKRDWPRFHAVYGVAPGLARAEAENGYVNKMETSYLEPPKSEFQRLRRRKQQVCIPGVGDDYDDLVDTLYNHVCRKFNALNVERVCRVEMQPGKDHSSLPETLKPWCLSSEKSAAARNNGWKGLYGRLDPKRYFGTALTEMEPMGKSGTVLLYDQRRVLSVRECARAQGFPDTFRLYSYDEKSVKDMHRQVGNAVPPPLAYALSLELRDALLKDCVQHNPDKLLFADYVENKADSTNEVVGDVFVDILVGPNQEGSPAETYRTTPISDSDRTVCKESPIDDKAADWDVDDVEEDIISVKSG
ncbi:hypothetical protein GGF40_000060 [Coemansia sp. RSA 1286]|nr:hypothetical protein IWW45_006919 [Coemansia sp. RSA 485]KAJ2640412.1 hypothetical protein GGF40_000060 [Coemansia sp. RSA 1286]